MTGVPVIERSHRERGERSFKAIASGMAALIVRPEFMGSLGLVGPVAPPKSRALTISACYVVTYLGLNPPVIGVGFAAGAFGLFASVAAFAATMAMLGLCVVFSTSKVKQRFSSDEGM